MRGDTTRDGRGANAAVNREFMICSCCIHDSIY